MQLRHSAGRTGRRCWQRPGLAVVALLWWLSALAEEPVVVLMSSEVVAYRPLLLQLLEKAGLTADIRIYPVARALQMTAHGETDAEFARTRLAVAGFADKVRLVGPVACIDLAAFVRRDFPQASLTTADLAGLKVAVLESNRLAVHLAEQSAAQVQGVNNTESLYRMLAAGRFDVVIDTSLIGQRKIVQLGLQESLRQASHLLISEPAYLVLRRRTEELGPPLQAALDEMMQSGQWQREFADVSESLGLPRQTSLHCLPPVESVVP